MWDMWNVSSPCYRVQQSATIEMFDANKYIHFVFGYSAVVLFIDAHDDAGVYIFGLLYFFAARRFETPFFDYSSPFN